MPGLSPASSPRFIGCIGFGNLIGAVRHAFRALFFLAMVFGAIIVFLAGYFASLYASDAIDLDT
jgi:hypothetical protein